MELTIRSREQAWAEANKIFPTDYEKDEASSQRAGYDIYRHPTLNYYSRICDLGNRLEVITGEYGENTVNIWIKKEGTMKRYTITVHNGNHPLTYKSNHISDAYACIHDLSKGLLKDAGINLNETMRVLVKLENGELMKRETHIISLEVEEVEGCKTT